MSIIFAFCRCRVAESEKAMMPISNLSRVLGPTLVRQSRPDLEPMQEMQEMPKTIRVVECLLHLSFDYWDKLLEVNNESTLYPSMSYGDSRLYTTERDRGEKRTIEQSLLLFRSCLCS